jgi:hypothetical protein
VEQPSKSPPIPTCSGPTRALPRDRGSAGPITSTHPWDPPPDLNAVPSLDPRLAAAEAGLSRVHYAIHRRMQCQGRNSGCAVIGKGLLGQGGGGGVDARQYG